MSHWWERKVEPVVRIAVRSDLPQIIQLCQQHAKFERSRIREIDEDSLSELMFGSPAVIFCLVVENDGMVVGYATCMKQFSTWTAKPYLYVDCLFISNVFRGKSIGRKLMYQFTKVAAAQDCDSLQWQTPEFNQRAIQFYQSLGATSLAKNRFIWDVQDLEVPDSFRTNIDISSNTF